MIEHVYRRACEATSLSRVIVATDDLRVFEAVRAFGGEVLMTSPHHRTGSERVAEVAAQLADDLIVNVQGDEPLLAPGMIDDAVAACVADPSLVMSTRAHAHHRPGRDRQPRGREGRDGPARAARSTSRVPPCRSCGIRARR